ncbi:addiction module protein [Desulfonatronum lacustre]|uniref:addiction module protein n=1 Tax=Desulfonatronum lacustre TaxID=66849 RepID=UPI0004BB4852|nr:addiction module protein [Desulfonatronum lacustre]SMP62779.1 Putative addiction module component [Desulfonatronum zhilinae]
MSYSLPLHKMTLAEKIGVMEEIWEDISKVSGEYEPPFWHAQILDERKRLAETGEVGFTDWETAKREIRESVS